MTGNRETLESYLVDHLDAFGRFKCPYCGNIARPSDIENTSKGIYIGQKQSLSNRSYDLIVVSCASCFEQTLLVQRKKTSENGSIVWQVHPIGRHGRPFPSTPSDLLEDYQNACRTLFVCPEASATMSRRCLQTLLQRQGYVQRDVAKQIDAILDEPDPEKRLPTQIRRVVDTIRQFGNFGAHQQLDRNSNEILPVEVGEAEWCIDIIERLFDFYFEEPALTDQRISAARLKFGSAGKSLKTE